MPLDNRCWLRLENGWTVSLSPSDTPPAICCLAAWPTRMDNMAMNMLHTFHDLEFFDFGDGRTDCRCWGYSDVRDALKKVSEASPPLPHS